MSRQRLEYSQPTALGKSEASAIFDSGAPEAIQQALVSIALLEKDLRWAYEMVLRGARMPHPGIRGTALLCLGHLARIHRELPSDEAVRLINDGLRDNDPYVRGQSENAADDVKMYVPELAARLTQDD
jgi:hypothetical protein